MPRVTHNQTNWTAGEISPLLIGRTDLTRYAQGAEIVQNAIPTKHGGIKGRDGSLFVCSAFSKTTRSRVIRYVHSRDAAYVMEFAEKVVRIIFDGGQVVNENSTPYEIESPYSADDVMDLTFAQSGGHLFIAHRNYPPARIRRMSGDMWVLDDVPFISEPTSETGTRMPADLVLAKKETGTNIVATSVGWIGGDVGRYIFSDSGGLALVTAVNSATDARVSILKPFPSDTIDGGTWIVSGSPQVTVTNSAKEPSGAQINISATGSTTTGPIVSISYVTLSETTAAGNITRITTIYTLAAHGLSAGSVFLISGSVSDLIKGNTDPNKYNRLFTAYATPAPNTIQLRYTLQMTPYGYAIMSGDFIDPEILATPGNLTSKLTPTSSQAFRPTDVGARVIINGGTAKIISITDASLAVAEIEAPMKSVVAAVKNAWSIEYPAWRSGDYPGAVSVYEQRLVYAGTRSIPNGVWMSVIGEYINFTPGVNDSDAISIEIASDEIADIRHLGQAKALIALTTGGEYTFFGGVEKPITPTNIQVKNQSAYGCNGAKPQRIGNELYFVQSSGTKLRGMAYKYDSDAFGSPDLSVMSEHLTSGGIVDMAYQQEPDSILWMVRADGVLISVTIDRDQDVIAWARHNINGFVESVCCVPAGSRDDLYLVVKRTINGETVRHIERMNGQARTDASVKGSVETATATWAGLDHLEGETVTVLADGSLVTPQVVVGGSITIERTANTVEIGLPFTPRIKTLTPEMATGTGSAQGNSMRVSEVSLRVHETSGALINGDHIAFRRFGVGVLDQPPPVESGVFRIETLGWERGAHSITIEGIPGVPFYILSAIYKWQVND
jgi:hypothetical protein